MLRITLKHNDLGRDIKALAKLGTTSSKRFIQLEGAKAFLAMTDETFEGQGRPKVWPPKKDGSPATLIRSGALRHSIMILNERASNCEVGTNIPYGLFHFLGMAPNPARPFFPVEMSGSSYRTTEKADRAVSQSMISAISKLTNGLLKGSSCKWSRQKAESHSLSAPV